MATANSIDAALEQVFAEDPRPVTVERRTPYGGLGRARFILRWQHDGAPCGQIWHGSKDELVAMLTRNGFAVPEVQ
jgi:hypothetical protein